MGTKDYMKLVYVDLPVFAVQRTALMVEDEAMGKYFIKPSGYRISGTDLRKGERPKKTNYCARDPCTKEYERNARFLSYFRRNSENAHTNNQPRNDHREVKGF